MNKVILIGNVGKNVDVKTTSNGKLKADFTVATRVNKDKSLWHKVVCFEKTAEIAQKYLSSGTKVCIIGAIDYSEYEKDGIKRVSTSIICHEIELLSPKSEAKPPIDNGEEVPF